MEITIHCPKCSSTIVEQGPNKIHDEELFHNVVVIECPQCKYMIKYFTHIEVAVIDG